VGGIHKAMAAVALSTLLTACALTTPGMVGSPDGGVVHPYPSQASPKSALRLANRFCHPYHKRAYLTQWMPARADVQFNCVY
jgi:hypothetical protein